MCDLEAMQWTRELNDLLNQCVFASGYDFAASSELFCQQAIKLRLWRGDGELVVTANQCQEQWMALNPTEEEDEDCPGFRTDEKAEEDEGFVVVPEGGPRLELSLSDAELDQLLSTLPPSEEPEAGSSSADAKDPQSEMQWVLAFLTNPDSIAPVDVEAKNMMRGPDKHEDDNYQVFLQDLHNANLMTPASSRPHKHSERQQAVEPVDNDDDSDSEEEEWERTRQAMKHSNKWR